MWYEPQKYVKPIRDINIDLKALKGELDDKQARITLAKFLHRNLGIATQLLTGIELYPDQIVTIKGLMKHNYSLCVWGRGVSKTWTAAVYCILQCIFEPKTSILVAGPTFRTARFIFNNIEKICDQPEAIMLFQAMGAKVRRNDEFRWNINGGEIVAIPLNGEKIRGFRANVLVIDEFLLMSEEMVEKVLIPYLVVPKDLKRRKRIREHEDDLVARGVITDAQRTKFENKAKLIALSSASYTCEYLYKKYDEYVKQIYSETMPENGATYFVSQMAWNAVSPDRIDKSIIELAQSNESNLATFKREYGAQFIDGSDSYFSMNKMIACTVPDGEEPTLLIRGDKGKKYILAIDPNVSNSPTGDDFGMCVVELDEDPKKCMGTVVHSYAEHGKDLKDHIAYIHYLMSNFNIVMVCSDYAGYQILEAANESQAFRDAKFEFKFFNFSAEKDGQELQEELKTARREYNPTMGRIVFTQYFTSDFIRKANEWLQGCFDYKKIVFAGSIRGNMKAFDKAVSNNINIKALGYKDDDENITNFIDRQELLIKQTKYQCAAIEVRTSVRGVQTFDLPTIMQNDSSSSRIRRDSYTALLLAAWGMKAYHDIMNTELQTETFEPFMV